MLWLCHVSASKVLIQQHSYAVEVGLEKESYKVAENVSDSDLALLVCANTSSDVLVGFTVTVAVQNGTALGKLVLHYTCV